MILGAVITAASEAAASVDAPPGAPTQLVSTTKATVHAAAAIATHGEYNTLHASVRFTYCVPLTFHVFAGRGASLGAAPEAVLEAASVTEAGVTPTAPEGGGGAAARDSAIATAVVAAAVRDSAAAVVRGSAVAVAQTFSTTPRATTRHCPRSQITRCTRDISLKTTTDVFHEL